jgi:hypothetical protein
MSGTGEGGVGLRTRVVDDNVTGVDDGGDGGRNPCVE